MDARAEMALAEMVRAVVGRDLDELEDQPRIAAEDAILAARRGGDVRRKYGAAE